jgi:hypothetical protein
MAKTCVLTVKDEVWCFFSGLDPADLEVPLEQIRDLQGWILLHACLQTRQVGWQDPFL